MNQDNKTTQEQTYYAADPFCETPHNEQQEQATPAAMTETPKKSKGMSITAMILGIASLVCGSIVANVVLAILSLVFVSKAKKRSETGTMDGFTTAGLICAVISLALTALLLIGVILLFVFLGDELLMLLEELFEFYIFPEYFG